MQEENAAKGVNPALEKHWEKIVLAVVIVLAVIFIGTKLSGGGNPAAKKVDAAVADFRRKVELPNTKIEPPKTVPQPKIPAVVAANRGPDWASGERTQFKVIIKEGKAEVLSFRAPAVSLNAPESTPEGVTISWSVAKLEKEPNPKRGDPIALMPPYFYRIERRQKGSEWKLLEAELKGDKDSLSHKSIDDSTEPKTEYEYRVTVGSRDNAFTQKNKSGLTEQVGGPVAVTTQGIWFVDFSNMQTFLESDEPKPGTAYVVIRKHDREHGLVEWRKIQQEGEFLGVIKEGGQEVSKHRTTDKNGKPVIVDFKMGGKIVKITTDKMVPYTYKVCKPKFDKNGIPECSGPEEVKEHYRINEVRYTDEDGKEQAFEQPAGPGKNADKLCPDHGGPPPVKELSPEEKLAKREAEATKMLDEADELWTSDKPAEKKKAQDIYRKLAQSYLDLESLKSRKSQIADRAKQQIK
jgi:hypothetical protein